MDKKDRLLIWYYKHHYLISYIWTALGWATLPAVAVIGKDSGWFTILFFVVYCLLHFPCRACFCSYARMYRA